MSEDICPHCNLAFGIVRVRFGLTGARLLSACPNCGLAQADGLLGSTSAPKTPWPPEHLLTAEQSVLGTGIAELVAGRHHGSTGAAEAGPGAQESRRARRAGSIGNA